MKKSLLHVAFAALLLVGCAQNEITDISPDAAPPVGFKVFTDAQTRGLITNGGAPPSMRRASSPPVSACLPTTPGRARGLRRLQTPHLISCTTRRWRTVPANGAIPP